MRHSRRATNLPESDRLSYRFSSVYFLAVNAVYVRVVFNEDFRTRRGSSRVSSCVKRGQGKGTEAACSRINKGSPESDRWKDKQTERNERVWISVESGRR